MIEFKSYIKVIAYTDNEEIRDLLDDDVLIGPEITLPLQMLNGRLCHFRFRENATVATLINAVKHEMREIKPYYRYWEFLTWALFDNEQNERYYLSDYTANLPYILREYFHFKDNESIEIQLLLSVDAGEVDNADGLEYYVHSHEKGRHNYPHVHVNSTDHEYSAVFRIEDAVVLAGKMPRKLEKKAQKRILNNQEYFFKCWNALTDGIRVDINKHFELIDY